jgi:hypothetical protein
MTVSGFIQRPRRNHVCRMTGVFYFGCAVVQVVPFRWACGRLFALWVSVLSSCVSCCFPRLRVPLFVVVCCCICLLLLITKPALLGLDTLTHTRTHFRKRNGVAATFGSNGSETLLLREPLGFFRQHTYSSRALGTARYRPCFYEQGS